MVTAANNRHKKTGAVAGFSVYPGCIERHLESMFGARGRPKLFSVSLVCGCIFPLGIQKGIQGACCCEHFTRFRPFGQGVPMNGNGPASRRRTNGQIRPTETPPELARLPQSNSVHESPILRLYPKGTRQACSSS